MKCCGECGNFFEEDNTCRLIQDNYFKVKKDDEFDCHGFYPKEKKIMFKGRDFIYEID